MCMGWVNADDFCCSAVHEIFYKRYKQVGKKKTCSKHYRLFAFGVEHNFFFFQSFNCELFFLLLLNPQGLQEAAQVWTRGLCPWRVGLLRQEQVGDSEAWRQKSLQDHYDLHWRNNRTINSSKKHLRTNRLLILQRPAGVSSVRFPYLGTTVSCCCCWLCRIWSWRKTCCCVRRWE